MALDASAPWPEGPGAPLAPPAAPSGAPEAQAGHPWAWRVLGAGLLWGACAAFLFREAAWGLNLALAVGVGGLVLAWVQRGQAFRLGACFPLLVALLAAMGQAWRASPHLRLADALVLLLALAWPLAPQVQAWGRRLAEGCLEGFAGLLAGPWHLLGEDVPWAGALAGRRMRDAGAVGLGLALALPFLLVFGALMAMADASFEGLVRDLLGGWPEGLAWAFWAFVWAWPAWGYARVLVRGPVAQAKKAQAVGQKAPTSAWAPPQGAKPEAEGQAKPVAPPATPSWAWKVDSREAVVATATALMLVDVLFAAFVALQLPHLFGGAGHLAGTPGLTAAHYARRGFFELSLLAALALPALVGTQAAAQGATGDGRRLLQALGGAAALMLGAVLLSAAHRMGLYAQAYGLTVARVEVLAAEAWGAFALLWYGLTVLRWKPQAFGAGLCLSALLSLGLLHLWPMEASVVRHDQAQGVQLDDQALYGFSADALPALVSALPTQPSPLREARILSLQEHFDHLRPRGWRDAHLAEGEALKALGSLGHRRQRLLPAAEVRPYLPPASLSAPMPSLKAPRPSHARPAPRRH